MDAANFTREHPHARLYSPLARLSSGVALSVVATFPVARSSNMLDVARVYADHVVYSGLRDAARSIHFLLAIESPDDAGTLAELTGLLRDRFPRARLTAHAYDELQNAAARTLWHLSKTLIDADAARHAFLVTGYSAHAPSLAMQVASETHVASAVVWPWRAVARMFNDRPGVGKAGYACDSTGLLLFHHHWVRAGYVAKRLPPPERSEREDYLRHWLERAGGSASTAESTVPLCKGDVDTARPGACPDVQSPHAYPSALFLECACPADALRLLRTHAHAIDELTTQEVASICSTSSA